MNSVYWIICDVKANWKKAKIRSLQTLTDKPYKKNFGKLNEVYCITVYICIFFNFIDMAWLQKINQHKVEFSTQWK